MDPDYYKDMIKLSMDTQAAAKAARDAKAAEQRIKKMQIIPNVPSQESPVKRMFREAGKLGDQNGGAKKTAKKNFKKK